MTLRRNTTIAMTMSDSNVRLACGWVLRSFAQHSLDALKNFASHVVPIAFLAMHQRSEGIL